MEFIAEYGLFLAKTLTLVTAIVVVFTAVPLLARKSRERDREELHVRKLNRRFRDMEQTLRRAFLNRKQFKALVKQRLKADKQEQNEETKRPRIFVLNFEGDIRATRVELLREEVTALLTLADPNRDRVVVRLESAGGLVHGYGLAASQLARIRDRGIPLTVAVDKVAASGGYMMAAVADRIQSAPFAILGSIGVVAQIPNVHRLLKKHDVDFEMLTAGKYKRTLTVFGENTDEGRAKFQQELNEAHTLFKQFLQRYRPQLDMDKVATGEHWFGEQAVDLGLVDELQTSDDLLMQLADEADLYEVRYSRKQPMSKRITLAFESALDRVLERAERP